jgi:ABC-2 type transport system permease protein
MVLAIPFAGPLLRHYLLIYGGDAGWTYSDMNGFGPFLKPFVWFKLYSAGWALVLAVVACLLWVRGRESGVRRRVRQARARFIGPVRRIAGVAFALILLIGGFIFYNTNVLNAFGADDETDASRAEYEKRYGRFENVAQPMIESARLRVEIYPDDPAVDVSGSFQLVNRAGASIDSIHVSSHPRLVTRSISFDREATAVVTDSVVGYRIYALARPLAPGDSMQLSFELAFRQRGFPNSGFQTAVVNNGTYFGRGWLPFVGYQPGRQLSDFEVRDEGRVRVETIIGTAADQIAITSGVLRREWMENGRRYFHYATESPQPFAAPVFSGRYAVRVERWHDPSAVPGREVTLAVYHHPDHDRNIDSFVRSMKASLAHFTTHFGPYAASDLRIVEVPRYHREARAHPDLIVLSEGRFIADTMEGQPDPLFFGMTQEIAHQWWDGQVRGAPDVRGREDSPRNRARTTAP